MSMKLLIYVHHAFCLILSMIIYNFAIHKVHMVVPVAQYAWTRYLIGQIKLIK